MLFKKRVSIFETVSISRELNLIMRAIYEISEFNYYINRFSDPEFLGDLSSLDNFTDECVVLISPIEYI